MSNFEKEYLEETNYNSKEDVNGWLCYTDNYVEWLENKLRDIDYF